MTDRRKLLLGEQVWSPIAAGPTAWYYAAGQFVTLSGTGVVVWADRLGAGSDIIQGAPGSRPTWEASGGWSASKPSIRSTAQPLQSTGGPIETVFSGTNRPFTVVATCQIISYVGPNLICDWTNAPGSAKQECNVTASQFMNAERVADAADSKSMTATSPAIGTGHVRLAYAFDGVTMSMYVGTTRTLVDQLDTTVATFGQFAIGTGRDIRYTEVIVYPHAFSAAEVAQYNTYSMNEWGA